MKIHDARAFARFWWLLAIGIGVALIAAVEMISSISVGLPPKVKYRSQPKYAATQLELVTTLNNPFLRTQERTVVPRPPTTQTVQRRGGSRTVRTVPQTPTVQVETPNVTALVRAANYYPYLIQSDPVVAIRNKRFGQLPGQITARALNSFATPNRYRESTFPIIEVVGTAAEPNRAIKLTEATVGAFREWLTRSQDQARIPKNERVLIRDLQRPEEAVASGGPRHGLDVLVGLVVFAAFGGLALVLDKLVPRSWPWTAAGSREPTDQVVAADAQDANQFELDLQPGAHGGADGSADLTTTRWAAEGPSV